MTYKYEIKKAAEYYEKAVHLQQQVKLSAAERSYKKSIKVNPDYVETYNDGRSSARALNAVEETFSGKFY